MMRAVRAAVAIIAAATALTAVAIGGGAGPEATAAAPDRPNVVVVMSDDQTLEEMRFLPATERLIGDAGATFPDSVVSWPLCCPSRATYLTGQYAHNHGVLGNSPPQGGFDRLDSAHTLPVWLQDAGYWTVHIGKFLNGYEDSDVGIPPGWSEWHGTKRTYMYYGFQLYEAGQVVTYGDPGEDPDAPAHPETYSTDVFTDKAVQAIDERAPSEQPFYLNVAYLAPHEGGPSGGRCGGSAKPAVRDAGTLDDEPLPAPPSFDEADVTDKPRAIAALPPLTPEQIAKTTSAYRCRAESLAAIDDGVDRIVSELRATGELDDTLIVFTSDNGFFHGEHRLAGGKNRVYEEAVRVPLLIRGPGIPRGVDVGDEVVNADLAPTIVDAAGARHDLSFDGRSLLPFTTDPERMHGREVLIEQDSPEKPNGNPRGIEYQAVRTSRFKFVRYWDAQTELYDLRRDPYELENLAGDPAYEDVRRALAKRLRLLGDCAGETCRVKPALELKLPDPVRKGGRSCRRPDDFTATVRSDLDVPSSAALVRVSFTVDGEPSGTVRGAPFRRKLDSRLLRGQGRRQIRAESELIDGRILTLTKRVGICRPG